MFIHPKIRQIFNRENLIILLMCLLGWEELLKLLQIITVSLGLWLDDGTRVSLPMPPIEVLQEGIDSGRQK